MQLTVVLASLSCGNDAVAPPAAVKYRVTFTPAEPAAGTRMSVAAQLVDAAGNNVRLGGRRVAWSNTAGGMIYDPTTSLTAADGSATAAFTLRTVARTSYQITAVDDRGISGSSEPFVSVAGPPVSYVVTVSSRSPAAGSTVGISAQLVDKYGNPAPVAGRIVTWSVAQSGGSFSSPTSATGADGTAQVNLILGPAAYVNYVVMANDNLGATGASPLINPIPGPASQYLTSPSEVDPPVGSSVVISAQLADPNGNRVGQSGIVVTWSVMGTGGTLSSNPSYTGFDGAATVVFTPSNVIGASYTVTATDPSGRHGTSSAFVTQPQMSVSAIATGPGSTSTCGWSSTGAQWCWGSNGVGQVGNGTTVDRALPGRVAGNLTFTTLSVGSIFACGLTPAGAAYCWGNNANGQLGDNSLASHSAPAAVTSPVTFQALTMGGAHACGLTAAGDVYCWGSNAAGQGGIGAPGGPAKTPVKVTGGLSFVAISAGDNHTCGITAAGSAYCWGLNADGQLGDLSLTARSAPVLVADGLKFVSISASTASTCAVANGGIGYCWGNNQYGQLGVTAGVSRTRPTAIATTTVFSSIVAGGFHSCGLTTGSLAYCWGDNSQGELGSGTTSSNSTPGAVGGGLQFKSITAGGTLYGNGSYYYGPAILAHTCGITVGGIAYCWGSSTYGEVGAGRAIVSSVTPVKVAGQP